MFLAHGPEHAERTCRTPQSTIIYHLISRPRGAMEKLLLLAYLTNVFLVSNECNDVVNSIGRHGGEFNGCRLIGKRSALIARALIFQG